MIVTKWFRLVITLRLKHLSTCHVDIYITCCGWHFLTWFSLLQRWSKALTSFQSRATGSNYQHCFKPSLKFLEAFINSISFQSTLNKLARWLDRTEVRAVVNESIINVGWGNTAELAELMIAQSVKGTQQSTKIHFTRRSSDAVCKAITSSHRSLMIAHMILIMWCEDRWEYTYTPSRGKDWYKGLSC